MSQMQEQKKNIYKILLNGIDARLLRDGEKKQRAISYSVVIFNYICINTTTEGKQYSFGTRCNQLKQNRPHANPHTCILYTDLGQKP